MVLFIGQSRNDLEISYDYAQFYESDSTTRFELYYALPVSDLTFVTEDTGLVARYRLMLQFLSNRKELVAGDVWLLAHRATAEPSDSTIVNRIELSVPDGKYTALLKVEDARSANFYATSFTVDFTPPVISGLRFQNGNHLNPKRLYQANDTLNLYWELANSHGAVDSFLLALKRGKEVMYRIGEKLSSSPRLTFTTTYPIKSLETGDYQISIVALDRTGGEVFRRTDSFSVMTPFYLSDKEYRLKVNELSYIAQPGEIERLRAAPKDQRLQAWQEFWKGKDPTPETSKNEALEEYFAKIDYCNNNFSKGDRGYQSDRAKVYMRYGPPDEVDSHPFDIDRQAYEVWLYYNSNLKFTFVDKSGFGQFVLDQPVEFQ
jgi:GWxTD domain-containing protein